MLHPSTQGLRTTQPKDLAVDVKVRCGVWSQATNQMQICWRRDDGAKNMMDLKLLTTSGGLGRLQPLWRNRRKSSMV